MTLEQHAAAISAAIHAAAADGFYVSSDGEDEPLGYLGLNAFAGSAVTDYTTMHLPTPA